MSSAAALFRAAAADREPILVWFENRLQRSCSGESSYPGHSVGGLAAVSTLLA